MKIDCKKQKKFKYIRRKKIKDREKLQNNDIFIFHHVTSDDDKCDSIKDYWILNIKYYMSNIINLISGVIIEMIFLMIIDMFDLPTYLVAKFGCRNFIILISLIIVLIFLNSYKNTIYRKIDFLTINILITQVYSLVVRKRIFVSKLIFTGCAIYLILRSLFFIVIKFFKKNREKKECNIVDLKDIYENKFNNLKNDLIFIDDKDVDYDLLNRKKIINDLYNSISKCKNEDCFVISLTGEWGSGKTTILNNVKYEIEKSNENIYFIDKFETWQYNNEKTFIYGMIDEFLKKTEIMINPLELRKFINGCIAIVEKKTDIKILNFITDYTIIDKVKSRIEQYLKFNDKRVVFVFDNLERTNTKNVIMVLKAISTILKMDRFIYVLSYDKEEMKRMFNKIDINYDYMEKVVQLPLEVPKIDHNRIQEISSKCIQNLFIYYGISDKKLEENKISIDLFSKKIKNLRTLKRMINSIINNCTFEKDELNIGDYLLIELIREENSELYQEIYENADFYVSVESEYSSDIKINIFEDRDTVLKNYFSRLFENEKNKKFEDMLCELFPRVAEYKEAIKYNNNVKFYLTNKKEQSIIKKRIFNGRFFGLYFVKNQNGFTEINSKIDKFIEWNNITKCEDENNKKILLKKIYNIIFNKLNIDQNIVLETFEYYCKDIKENRLLILKNFINIREKLNDDIFLKYVKSKKSLLLVCLRLIKSLTNEELDLLNHIIKNDYKNLIFWKDIVDLIKDDNDIYDKISASYNKLINNIVEKKINIYCDKYYSRCNLLCLINKKDFLDILKINQNNIFKFLADITLQSYNYDWKEKEYECVYTYELNITELNKVSNYDELDSIFLSIDENNMTENEKMLKEIYIKSKNKSNAFVYKDKFVNLEKIVNKS